MSFGNILVVDDRSENLQLLEQLLERRDYDVRTATSGEMALRTVELEPPDLILLDIMMPGMNGFETCHRLKEDPRTGEIPVLFISAKGEVEDKVRGFEVGGVDYLTKPFEEREVLERVRTHLELFRSRKALADNNRQLEQAYVELRVSQDQAARLGRIVDNSLNEIYLFDLESLKFIQVNRGARANLGYSMEELHALTPLDLNPKLTPEIFERMIIPLHNGEQEVLVFETALKRKDGTQYDVEVHLELVRKEGPPVFIAIIQDITSRKAAEAKLSAIDRFREQFIAQPDTSLLYNALRDDLMALTESKYGLIGEVMEQEDGSRYLIAHSLSNLAWDDATRRQYEECPNKGFEFHKLDNLFGRIVTHGELVISNDPAHDPRHSGCPEDHPTINSFLGIPVFFGDQLVGEIGLANRPGGYDQALVDFLAPVVSVLGQIIVARQDREARTVAEKELRRLATTDSLTGVANRNRFDELLKVSMARAVRYSEDLTLLMFDIDHFKAVNDTYGHDAGDLILVGLVQRIETEIREVDLLARWGGEEFMILLPHTNAETGQSIAERIRQQIEEQVFDQPRNITLSIGLTSLHEDDTPNSIIKRADDALYLAKGAGRNRVMVA